MAVIAFPKILTDRLTDEGARALAEILDRVEESSKSNSLEAAENRFEKRLAEELGKLRSEMHDELGKLRSDVIRWMFIFWIGQAATVIGIMQAFLSKH